MNSYFFNINKIQNQVIKYMPKKYQGEPYNRITAKELYALSKTKVDAVSAANIFWYTDQSIYLSKKYLYEQKHNIRKPDLIEI